MRAVKASPSVTVFHPSETLTAWVLRSERPYNGKWQIPKEDPIQSFVLYDFTCPVIMIKKQSWEAQQSSLSPSQWPRRHGPTPQSQSRFEWSALGPLSVHPTTVLAVHFVAACLRALLHFVTGG